MSKPSVDTTHGLRRIQIRLAWIWLGLASTVAALFVGTWILLDRAAESRLKEAVAEADRTDPRWRLADVLANRARVPDAENSALRVKRVLDQLAPDWMSPVAGNEVTAASRLYTLSNRLSQLDPLRRLSDDEGRQLHVDLADLKPARSLAIELARMPAGRYDLPSRYLFLDEPMDHAQKLRQVVRLLRLEAIDRIQQNDIDGALEACCAIVNAGRSIGDEPNLLAQMIRMAIDSVALHTMQRALAQGRASDRALVAFQECLTRESEEPIVLFGLNGDRATSYDTLQRLAAGEINFSEWAKRDGEGGPVSPLGANPFPKMFIRFNEALFLESMNRAVAIANRPPWEQPKLWLKLEADRQAPFKGPDRLLGILAKTLAPVHGVAGLAFLRVKALLCAGQALVAAERFRLAHGRWPEAIDALAPRFLPATPIDPFTGHDLILKKLDEGLVIYSLGADQTDNGGRFEPRGRDDPGYDLGYRLWNEEARGRSAEK